MGRPCSRGVVLRDHGTERPEGLPTMGTAPKTQKRTRCKKKAMTSEGLFRRLAHSFLATIDRDTRQTRSTTYSISYNIASRRRNGANTQQTRKLARVISSGPRAEGVGHSPPSTRLMKMPNFLEGTNQSQLEQGQQPASVEDSLAIVQGRVNNHDHKWDTSRTLRKQRVRASRKTALVGFRPVA